MDKSPLRGNTESGETHGQEKSHTNRDDRRDVRRKKKIFKNGIKGIKNISGKYNTSKPLTEVKNKLPVRIKVGMARQ